MQMILKEWNGRFPQIADSAFVAEDAVLIGDVCIDAHASVWYGCILRADTGSITVGAGSNVQDGTIMHCDKGYDVVVGRGVTIGHGAIVHGAHLEDDVLIGMRATLLNGAYVESESIVGACALVSEDKRVKRHQVALGAPFRARDIRPDQIEMIRWNARHYVELAEAYRAEK